MKTILFPLFATLAGLLRSRTVLPYGKANRTDEAIAVASEALATAERTGEWVWEPELHRLKGELLLSRSADQCAEAESCLQNALDAARRRLAKSPELRAATSLGRLWQLKGKREEARELVGAIYDWFTEGFDTADLKEAKALLEELSA
jgi:predicted ATPase